MTNNKDEVSCTNEFNKKVAELLKNSNPEEITEILKDEKSMLVNRHVNHINNH